MVGLGLMWRCSDEPATLKRSTDRSKNYFMRHNKYITSQILLACLSKPIIKKDVHAELAETIAERERIMRQMEDFSKRVNVINAYLGTNKAA